MGLLQQLLPTLGGIAIALGWLTKEQVAEWVAFILQIAGPLMIVAGLVWSFIVNSKAAIITSAAQMTDSAGNKLVKSVEVANTPEGRAIAAPAVTPANVIVSALQT